MMSTPHQSDERATAVTARAAALPRAAALHVASVVHATPGIAPHLQNTVFEAIVATHGERAVSEAVDTPVVRAFMLLHALRERRDEHAATLRRLSLALLQGTQQVRHAIAAHRFLVSLTSTR